MRLRLILPLLLLAGCASASGNTAAATGGSNLERARRILASAPLVDGHNDLPWVIRQDSTAPHDVAAYDLRKPTRGHTDIARLRAGLVGGQFWSVYIPGDAVKEGAAKVQLEQIDIAHQFIRRYPDVFELALRADDVARITASGRIASMIGMEGGHAIENSLGALRAFYNLGARYMTLTHSVNIDWADSCCQPGVLGGLSPFGVEVVREMNRLGMLVDLSHVSPETMIDVLDVVQAPVIFSHSSARAITDVPRNVPDNVLRRLAQNGGVVMITFVPGFINNDVVRYAALPVEQRRATTEPRATIADVIRHIEHVRDVAGIDNVGLGGDFDGITSTPVGLEDVSTYPALFAALLDRGWSETDLRKLAGGNVMRAWKQAEAVADRLQRERGAATTLFRK